jgi:hypothetical protein
MSDDAGVSNDLHLLLSHADSGEPTLPEGLPDGALTGEDGRPEGEPEEGPQYLYDGSADPQSLPDQRWGVIVPEGARGDRLLDLIRPLMDRRAEQQGAPVNVYRLPPKMSAGEAMQWKRDHFNSRAGFGLEVPAYQLLLGDLDELPLSAQQALCIDGFTGRLAFDQDDQYRAYAEKVLRFLGRPAAVEPISSRPARKSCRPASSTSTASYVQSRPRPGIPKIPPPSRPEAKAPTTMPRGQEACRMFR